MGGLGVALPLLPATPFILLAAFCFARSSPAIHDWLLRHPTFGPVIRDWREHRAISRKSKVAGVVAMALSLGISIVLGVELLLVGVQAIVLSGAASFVLTRKTMV